MCDYGWTRSVVRGATMCVARSVVRGATMCVARIVVGVRLCVG